MGTNFWGSNGILKISLLSVELMSTVEKGAGKWIRALKFISELKGGPGIGHKCSRSTESLHKETVKQESLAGFRALGHKEKSALPNVQFGDFKWTLSSHTSFLHDF